MLRLVLRGIETPSKPVVHDVEWQFARTELVRTERIDKLLRDIEQATWADEGGFIDRFGFKLYWSDLSTGCKAAILVELKPDKCINLAECGENAVNSILQHCRDGEVLVDDIYWGLPTQGDCDVICCGKRFVSMKSLSEFIEWGGYSEI